MCVVPSLLKPSNSWALCVVMVLIHQPVERDAAFQAWELVMFYKQDVLLKRVEGEFLYVDSKGREVSEIVDV